MQQILRLNTLKPSKFANPPYKVNISVSDECQLHDLTLRDTHSSEKKRKQNGKSMIFDDNLIGLEIIKIFEI